MTTTFRDTQDYRDTAPVLDAQAAETADLRPRRGARRFGRRNAGSLRLRIDLCLADATVAGSLGASRAAADEQSSRAEARDEVNSSHWSERVSA